MALKQGYTSLPQYMAYHFQAVTHIWFMERGLDLKSLLVIKVF